MGAGAEEEAAVVHTVTEDDAVPIEAGASPGGEVPVTSMLVSGADAPLKITRKDAGISIGKIIVKWKEWNK
jgi:CO dehydrogenase/acetyl-CoA synthase beta subunit